MGGRLLGPSGRYELGAAVASIGRSPANSVVISDAQVSAHHAEVWPEGCGYLLVDLGSTNGTVLNGQRLQPQLPYPLHGGDVITLGNTQVAVEIDSVELPPTVRASPPAASPYAPTARVAGSPYAPGDVSAPGGLSPPEPTPSSAYGFPLPPMPSAPTPSDQYSRTDTVPLASYYTDPLPLVPPPPPGYSPPPPDFGFGTTGARPRSKRRRIAWMAGGAALALVLVIVAIFGVTNYITAHSPEGITKSYYTDLQGQNYENAYQYLDSRAQRLFDNGAASVGLVDGQELFMNSYACLDRQFGEVLSFSASQTSASDTLARIQVTVTRAEIGTYTEEVRLIQENGAWKVDDVTFLTRGASSCFSRPQTQRAGG